MVTPCSSGGYSCSTSWRVVSSGSPKCPSSSVQEGSTPGKSISPTSHPPPDPHPPQPDTSLVGHSSVPFPPFGPCRRPPSSLARTRLAHGRAGSHPCRSPSGHKGPGVHVWTGPRFVRALPYPTPSDLRSSNPDVVLSLPTWSLPQSLPTGPTSVVKRSRYWNSRIWVMGLNTNLVGEDVYTDDSGSSNWCSTQTLLNSRDARPAGPVRSPTGRIGVRVRGTEGLQSATPPPLGQQFPRGSLILPPRARPKRPPSDSGPRAPEYR